MSKIHLVNHASTLCGIHNVWRSMRCSGIIDMCTCKACYGIASRQQYISHLLRWHSQPDPAWLHYQAWKMMGWFSLDELERWQHMLQLAK